MRPAKYHLLMEVASGGHPHINHVMLDNFSAKSKLEVWFSTIFSMDTMCQLFTWR